VSELTFLILRLGFLAVLWLFVFGVFYALRSDLFGAPARRMRDRKKSAQEPMVAAPPAAPVVTHVPVSPEPAPATDSTSTGLDLPSAGATGPARKLLITSGVAEGTQLTLDEGLVTIGRSPDSTLVIVDEYTSTHHAQLKRGEHDWTITDLDSTNGTKLDGKAVTGTTKLPPFTPVTIGTTTFELRP
jgi:pSer/pThr/pTyr-binding forkhead associated (FHA) protein